MKGTKTTPGKGRPTDITPELTEKLCNLLLRGNYLHVAATSVGIHRESLNYWLKRGAKEQVGVYADFSNAVHKAVADSEARLLDKLQDVGDQDWKAHAHVLRYRHQSRWGTEKSEVESHTTVDVKQELADVLGKIGAKTKKTSDETDD